MPKKKILTIALALVAFFFCLLLALPQLLRLAEVRQDLTRAVEERLAGTLRVERLQWTWLPFPHLTLAECRFDSETLTLRLPRIEAYPNWLALLRNEFALGRVLLEEPEFTIKSVPAASGKNLVELLPHGAVEIKNGLLLMAAPSPWPSLRSREFSLRNVNGRFAVAAGGLDFSLEAVPSFGERVRLVGGIERGSGLCRLEFDCRKIKLHEVLLSLADQELEPVESLLNVSGRLEGTGPDSFQAELAGDLPCLLAFPRDKKILLNCGFADLAITRQAGDLLLTVKEFVMKEPGLSLAGTIRRQAAGRDAPRWEIALDGTDLNLTQIRDSVLAMWGGHEIAKTVTDIVLSGRAGKARYAFSGRSEDFHNIRSMVISAEDIDAAIRLPVGGLLLDNTRGSMLIEDGRLQVKGDSARLGDSKGKNCKLEVGLAEDDDAFFLDVDLDADLAELQGVLGRLIDDPPFLAELAKFRKVSGSASGHLRIEDKLNDIRVSVEVADIRGQAEYLPLNWGFTVEGGGMSIAPNQVQWREIQGQYGPHRILRASGSVDWEKETRLAVTSLDATVFAPDLQAGALSFWKKLDTLIAEQVSNLEGSIELRKTSLTGTLDRPESWQGGASLAFDGLLLRTPLLPGEVRVQKGRARLTESTIEVGECQATILDAPFSFGASLRHADLEALRGTISLTGLVGEELGSWLRERHFPANKSLFPRLPFRLASLKLTLAEEKWESSGVLIPGDDQEETTLPRAEFTTISSPDNPLRLSLHVLGNQEEARLDLDALDRTPETFLFTWKGSLSEQTVEALLAEEKLLTGAVAGDFQLYLPADPTRVAFAGELRAEGLRWFFDNGTGRFADITDIHLEGAGNELKIKNLSCALSSRERIQASGLLTRGEDGLVAHMDLVSPSLSRQTLVDFSQDLKSVRERYLRTGRERAAGDQEWSLTGTVNFSLEEFIFSQSAKPGETGLPTSLVWQPLRGFVRIQPGWRLSATVSSGRLCCLDTTGQWFSSPELGTNSFQLLSARCEIPPRFERVLPCLGYPQDLIEGEFSLTANISGSMDKWQDGYLNVESRAGRILRMKLLSRIFSVVNITDLFTPTPEGAKVGSSGAGFPYSSLRVRSHIKDNELIIDEAVVRGSGLNLFARGKMNIVSLEMDFVVLISPFKTLDAILSKIPLLGRVIGGETGTLVTFPVAVRGPVRDPEVTLLPPSAVGEGILNIVKRTLLLPFTILSPVLPDAVPEEERR